MRIGRFILMICLSVMLLASCQPNNKSQTQAPAQDSVKKVPEIQYDRYWNDLARYFAGFGHDLPPPGLYERILAEVEPPLLRATLAATSGNQLRAADLLGINRNTLRVKLRERNVKVVRGYS